jgi:hypothetical protein
MEPHDERDDLGLRAMSVALFRLSLDDATNSGVRVGPTALRNRG